MNWNDPGVQAAVITAVGAITATAIGVICAALIGRQFADRKRLQEKLQIAQNDILALLEIERVHCDLHMEHSNRSFKKSVRQTAEERGYVLSGKNTPSRIKASNPANVQMLANHQQKQLSAL